MHIEQHIATGRRASVAARMRHISFASCRSLISRTSYLNHASLFVPDELPNPGLQPVEERNIRSSLWYARQDHRKPLQRIVPCSLHGQAAAPQEFGN